MRANILQVVVAWAVVVMAAVNGRAAPWTPDSINSNLVMWCDASDLLSLTTNASGAVSVWQDKSTNGVDALQVDSASQPTSGVRVLNGLNVLDCAGEQYMRNDTNFFIPASGDVAFFMVAEIDVIDHSNDTVYRIAGTNWFSLKANNSAQFDGRLDVKNLGSGASLTNGPYHGPSIYNVNFDYNGAGVYNAFIDGHQRTTDESYVAKPDQFPGLRLFSQDSAAQKIDGAMAEFVVVEDPSLDTRQKMEGYLAHKWGLEENLPQAHPYRYAVPGTDIQFSDLVASNITTTATLYATAKTNLTSMTVVWDTSDKGDINVLDWTGSDTAAGSTPGAISGNATGLTPDTLYYFRFYGEGGGTNGWSTPGAFAAALSGAQTPAFTIATSTHNSVTLQWNDNANTETGYILQRSTNGTSFSLLTTLPPDTTNYTDGAVLTERTYYYRLAATNSVNGSGTDPSACETNATPNLPAGMIFYENFEDPVIDGNVTNAPTGWVRTATIYGTYMSDSAVAGKTGDQYARCTANTLTELTTTTNVLNTNLAAHVLYTISCDTAHGSTDFDSISSINLRAGTNVLTTHHQTSIKGNDFSATRMEFSYIALSDNPYIGDKLGLSLWGLHIRGNGWAGFDNLTITATDTSGDATPPTPGTLTWIDLPTSSESNSITMQATNAVDPSLVQYFFTNTVNGNVSGWQDSRIWTDTGLTPGVTYSYQVKARDKSAGLNETGWSSIESAECEQYIILYESFEEPRQFLQWQSDGVYRTPGWIQWTAFYPGPPEGWTADGADCDSICETNGFLTTPFGQQFAAQRDGVAATAFLAGHLLEQDYTYRVTFCAGGSDYGMINTQNMLTNLVELLAGSTVVASTNISTTTSDFSESGELLFVPGLTHTNLGEALSIKLTTRTSFWQHHGLWDNIKVYAIPPDPKGTVLIIR